MTDEEVLRTLQSMKPCVVNAEAQNEAIDRACEWGEKLREIQEIAKKHRNKAPVDWIYGFMEIFNLLH